MKQRRQSKLLTVLLAFTMLLTTMFPTVVVAQSNTGITFEVANSSEFLAAFDKIQKAEGTYTISLNADITLDGGGSALIIRSNREVTLLGNGYTIYFESQYGVLQVNGGMLNLGNESGNQLTIDASGKPARREPLVRVHGGTNNMYEGVTLKGNDNSQDGGSTTGGGVSVEPSRTSEYGDSIFNMYGGVITECKNGRGNGGGVCVGDEFSRNGTEAVFNMYNGDIINNESTAVLLPDWGPTEPEPSGGAGVAVLNKHATFNMYDGLIAENKSTTRGGGVYSYFGKKINIEGGTIRDNSCVEGFGTGGGICVGGVNYHPSFPSAMTISGGTITDNSAWYGGGIYFEYSNKIDISNTKIAGNFADQGGGVYIFNSGDCAYISESDGITFINSEISGNQAKTGGGLFVRFDTNEGTLSTGSSVSASSKGNIICNNTASGYAADVYLTGGSVITLPNAKDMEKKYLGDQEGYTIDGWYDDSEDLRYEPKPDAQAVDVSAGLTDTQALIASYEAPLTVTFDLQGGTWTDTNDIYVEKDGKYIEKVYMGEKARKPNTPERQGYVFDGWYIVTATDNGSRYNFDISTVTESITLYAKWLKKVEPLNAIPTINASDKTLMLGDTFNPLDGVTASDKEDGDLTKDIEVTSNDVDTTKAGTYTVIYKVTDSTGASSTRTITVTVKEKDTQPPGGDGGNLSNPYEPDTDSPQTGNTNNIPLWTALLLVSGGAVLALTLKRKHQDI